jgi:hypothetical protein
MMMFGKRMLSPFGPRKEDVMCKWTERHEALQSVYFSPNVIKVIKRRRMRWVSISTQGEGENGTNI